MIRQLRRGALAVYHWQPTHRQRLVGFVVVVAVAAFGLWRVETTANRADALSQQLDAEADARIEGQCQGARTERAADRDVLLRIAREAGASTELIGIVEASYTDRAEPASCALVADP
jgi:hypothetical protein